jgi:hypothetical protein
MSTEDKATIDLAFINHINTTESIKAFIAEHDIRLPIYQSTPKTCLRMNCHPYLPYFVGVTGAGRISFYYGWPDWLEKRLTPDEMKESKSGFPGSILLQELY